jgi:RNA methyltransferase, TrmH family
MRHVTSLQNPIIKLIRSLDQRKYRKESGLFVAEGMKVLDRAKTEGWEAEYIVSIRDTPEWGKAQSIVVTAEIMQSLSGQRNPTDIIGVFRQRFHNDIEPAGVWLALDTIRDPGNLGAIIRTSDAVAAKGVILIGESCDPYSREAVRSTMGSIFGVPLYRMSSDDFIALCRRWPGETVATDAQAPSDFRRRYRGPVMLVMGSEGDGLSPAIAAACSTRVRIPMPGGAESLNVAVAAGIMLYEISRASK